MTAAPPVRATHASPLRLALIAVAAVLAGCAAPRETIRRVEVPVAVPCPAPTLPPRPHLPLADLPPDATDADIARATAASLEAFFGYAQALETLIDVRATHASPLRATPPTPRD